MTSAGLFTILDTVDSTNNYAMQQAQDGLAKQGSAWFANEQTAGKGQRGKSWAGEKGKNIAMSVVLVPGQLKITSHFHLSAMVALACFEFLKQYAGDEMKIKWPNDLFWRDRKAGGILIENKLYGKAWKWAVVGIGININQEGFNKDLANAISLKQITGKNFNTIALAKELHGLLMKKLADAYTPDKIMQQYNQHLYKINESVTLRKAGVKFDTVIKEVSAQGRLITVDAIEREFDFGEVEWVL
ncbi:MAG: biotin--[acetyl-CoA-carboxylase] ligase [Ferruginibacter sp.]|nr:biotin--[acetyl-CoA-carboxylase] ligase [Chitinophagaceae bacterium]